jgi:ABC-2 type transport system ATP-binding protein
MIEVKDLTKYYGSFAAIQALNFEVADGEIVGFLGPNAAGKTTTLKILAGYMPPTSGTATVCGLIMSLNLWRPENPWVPARNRSLSDLTVNQFLILPASYG